MRKVDRSALRQANRGPGTRENSATPYVLKDVFSATDGKLKPTTGEEFALRSDRLKLDSYAEKQVEVKGRRVQVADRDNTATGEPTTPDQGRLHVLDVISVRVVNAACPSR